MTAPWDLSHAILLGVQVIALSQLALIAAVFVVDLWVDFGSRRPARRERRQ